MTTARRPEAETSSPERYQLVRRIAVGGMAEIFLARAVGFASFEKPVVLKRILPQLAGDAEFLSMFLNEARLAATLHHPNIVQVYDIGRRGDDYFFSMEYVHGEPLSKILSRLSSRGEHLPLECALHIAAGVAAGLHYAHQRCDERGQPLGIVHRDVSPSNILVTHDGDVKLVDFGIAKAANGPSFTEAGTLKGKIPYMSPEQCLGEALDRRSDVFSLGVVLYELTTTTRLFAGGNEISMIRRVLEKPIAPPSMHRSGYPTELERMVMKALERDLGRRYQSADELAVDLEQFAARHRLVLSARPLARFMRELFGPVRPPTLDGSHAELAWSGHGPEVFHTDVTAAFSAAPQRARSSSFPLPPPPQSERIAVATPMGAPVFGLPPPPDDARAAADLLDDTGVELPRAPRPGGLRRRHRGWLLGAAGVAGAAGLFLALGGAGKLASSSAAPAGARADRPAREAAATRPAAAARPARAAVAETEQAAGAPSPTAAAPAPITPTADADATANADAPAPTADADAPAPTADADADALATANADAPVPTAPAAAAQATAKSDAPAKTARDDQRPAPRAARKRRGQRDRVRQRRAQRPRPERRRADEPAPRPDPVTDVNTLVLPE